MLGGSRKTASASCSIDPTSTSSGPRPRSTARPRSWAVSGARSREAPDQGGWLMSEQRARLAVLGAILLGLAPRAARATQKFGPIQLSGNLQTANIVRTPDQNTYEYIMNRNTAHVRLDYDWLQSGKFYNKYDIPFLESSHLSVVWRGVYDSIYDTTPGFIQKEDIHGRAYGNRMTLDEYRKLLGLPRSVLEVSGLSRGERDALRFDNQLREFYIDLKFRNLPLSVRAGRQ